MKKSFFKLFLTVVFITVTNMMFAQGPPPPPPPPGLPIDGGIALLFISGLIFGVFKIRK